MGRGFRWRAPGLVVAAVALVTALGGTVYAAGKINGHAVKVKSMPGNRLALRSVPGNRLKPRTIGAAQLAPGAITGVQIDVSTLPQVPSATHADSAEVAASAETAQNAVNAENAQTLNGHEAACRASRRYFAGACWQTSSNETALEAPDAAAFCASLGGELPDALMLAAYSREPGIVLAEGDEWSGDIPVVTGEDLYAVATVSAAGKVKSAGSTATKKFRCVFPLVS